jgi:hypothetical protein
MSSLKIKLTKIHQRKVLSSILLLISIITLVIQVRKLFPELSFRSDDFATYWRVGWLNVAGLNPYSPELLYEVQKTQICSNCKMPTFFWYPPWSILIFIPFSLIPYGYSRLLWLALSYILLIISGLWFWKLYNGPKHKRWLALVLSISFAPAIFALVEGAITPILLIGIAGFLHFEDRRQWWSLGICGMIMAIKPHLFYLFWLALIIHIFFHKRWNIIWACAIAFIISNSIMLFQNPTIFSEYIDSIHLSAPHTCSSATLSSFVCLIAETRNTWLQWALPIGGIIWLIFRWNKEKYSWQWKQEISIILLVSLITVPYAWMHDFTLLILPVLIQTIKLLNQARIREFIVFNVAFQLINISSLVLIVQFRYMQPLLFWVPIALLFLFIKVDKNINRNSVLRDSASI